MFFNMQETAFRVHPGIEELTVTGAGPGDELTLISPSGERLITYVADRHGQARFAYLDLTYGTFRTGRNSNLLAQHGRAVPPGNGYLVHSEQTGTTSDPIEVVAVTDHPDVSHYESQSDLFDLCGDETERFGYITMRDGVKLSVNVKLPGSASDGPYPTIIEYSGYSPSNPNTRGPSPMLAAIMGFAFVGVNIRGTGCSGGVFDIFYPPQAADGYDAIEIIARQSFVKGNRVGLAGASYPGMTQPFIAALQPPSLACVASATIFKDMWFQQWPGGVINTGFSSQWLKERERQALNRGASWVGATIESGDVVAASHMDLRDQNMDLEGLGRKLTHRPQPADRRDCSKVVSGINVPVFLAGAWQDEISGSAFADLIPLFESAPVAKFALFNGRHADGFSPLILTRWFEFLSFYLDGSILRIPDTIRGLAEPVFAKSFGHPGLGFEPDRFAAFSDDEFDAALAAYEAEPPVRVVFEVGAGDPANPGSPVGTFETHFESWPPAGTEKAEFFFDGNGGLTTELPETSGAHVFENDPDSGSVTSMLDPAEAGPMDPFWDFNWQHFDDRAAVAYVSEPFSETMVLGGAAHADLHIAAPDGDADIQVTLSLIRPNNDEWFVTSGLLRLSDRKLTHMAHNGLSVERSHSIDDSEPMPDGVVPAKVYIAPFAQVFRPGDRLRVQVSSPGRDFVSWSFEVNGKPGAERIVGFGPDAASRLIVGVLPISEDTVPAVNYPHGSLRGQAHRTFAETVNHPADLI